MHLEERIWDPFRDSLSFVSTTGVKVSRALIVEDGDDLANDFMQTFVAMVLMPYVRKTENQLRVCFKIEL